MMNMRLEVQENRSGALSVSEAQTEVFWLAFQALPKATQLAIRQRILVAEEMPDALATELENCQVATSEALMNFDVLLHEA